MDEARLRNKSINKVIFVPKFPGWQQPQQARLPRTQIGPHVFVKQKNDVFVHSILPNGLDAIVLAQPLQSRTRTWRLEYDPDLHDDSLSSLQTTQGRIRACYDSNSPTSMRAMKDIQAAHAKSNFNNSLLAMLPTEVRVKVYKFAATRDFHCCRPSPVSPIRSEWSRAHPSILLNLQMTCRYLHDDVTTFIFEHNQFYFCCSEAIENLLRCSKLAPLGLNTSHHFGVIILDLRRNTSHPLSGRAMPVLPDENGDWDAQLADILDLSHASRYRQKVADSLWEQQKNWSKAVRALLESNTIGKLVINGNSQWVSALFSTTPLVRTLLEFKGQGRITKVCKAGYWPQKGADKVLQLLEALEEDAVGETKGKRKARASAATGGRRKRKTDSMETQKKDSAEIWKVDGAEMQM